MNHLVIVCSLLVSKLAGANGQSTESLSHTFSPDNLNTFMGEVTSLRSDVEVNTVDNQWEVQGSNTLTPISMALRTIIYGDTRCDNTIFSIYYDATHPTTTEGDGAIIISAGSEYLSFMFDYDGASWIGGPGTQYVTGGTGIYPACDSTGNLPQFPKSSTDSSSLFDDSQDTYNPSGTDNSFWNLRDRMVDGDRRNWTVFDSNPVGDQGDGFKIAFEMDSSLSSIDVTFTAGSYSASCTINSVFSFDNGNDIYVDFSPDYHDEEVWQINSIKVTTDCDVDSPTTMPTSLPIPSPTQPTLDPTPHPTKEPTDKPSPSPSPSPTLPPTYSPTYSPTGSPTNDI